MEFILNQKNKHRKSHYKVMPNIGGVNMKIYNICSEKETKDDKNI